MGDSLIRMELMGAAKTGGEGVGKLPGLSSYFGGRTARDWHTGIPQYDRVRYRNVYAGIDLVYYGNQGKLEYDFVLAPGADASQIRLAYGGLKTLRLDSAGNLILATSSGEIRQRRPTVYQEVNGRRIPVAASYRLARNGEVRIQLAAHDERRELVVDPVLEYGTFLGSNAASGVWGVKVDASGNVYIGGYIWNRPYSPTSADSSGTAMVIKFSPAQNKILYWAALTPDGQTQTHGIDIDSAGNAYITGVTSSSNLPLVNAFQKTLPAHGYGGQTSGGFVSKLAPDGQSLVYSTYLGGSQYDYLNGIAVDQSGNAFVTGQALSKDFPIVNAVQSKSTFSFSNAVLVKFSPTGTVLFSTFFGGSNCEAGSAIAIDRSGSPVIVGMAQSKDFPAKNAAQAEVGTQSAFAAKFTPDGQGVLFATPLAGTWSTAGTLVIDAQNNVWVGGAVSPNSGMPLKNPLQTRPTRSFFSKLSADGSQLLSQSYFGGSVEEFIAAPQGMAMDSSGHLYIAGVTYSPDFPVKDSLISYQKKAVPGQSGYGFVTELSADGQSMIYSTLLGGTQAQDWVVAVTLDSGDAVWASGTTFSNDFPVTPNAYQSTLGGTGAQTAFVVKLTGGTSQPGNTVSLTANPGVLNFAYTTGSAQPSQQSLSIGASNGAAMPFTAVASISSGGNWLSINSNNGTTPAQITVTANPAGLPAGYYSGTIHLAAANANSADIGVWLSVSTPVTPLIVSAPNLSFPAGGQQLLFVSTNSGTAVGLTASATTSNGGNWLSVSPSTATTPAALTVTANPAGLAQGSYYGTLHLAPSSGGTALNVEVSMTVQQQVSLTANPSAVTFQAAAGGSSPAAQSATVTSSAGSTGYSVSVPTGGNWLSASPASGTLPATISISANPAGLGAATYSGTVRVTGSNGAAINVTVTLIVQASPPAVSPSSLSFNATAGGAAPQSQSLNVTATGGAVNIAASAIGASWLTVSPSSGTTPAKLTVSAAGNAMAVGSYSASISIAGGGGTVSIPVTLQVIAAPVVPAALTSLSPSSLPANAPQTTVTLKGSGFVAASSVHLAIDNTIADQAIATTYVDGNTLQIGLTSDTLAQGRTLSLTVVNPGAVPSNALNLTVTDAVPQFSASGVKNAASMVSGSVAPGELISITGSSLGPAQGISAAPDASDTFPPELGSVRVLFDGHPAPILYLSASQINAIVPLSVAGASKTAIQVEYQGRQSTAQSMSVATSVPGLFTADSSGAGRGAILNADMSQNLSTHPAAAGSIVVLYATGAGQMDQPLADGRLVAQPALPLAPVSVTIDGQSAQVLYAGAAPTLVAGVLQVNVVVPASVRPGPAVPVSLRVGDAATQPGVTLSVQ